MASALMRRSAMTALLAAVATIASPLLTLDGVANAAATAPKLLSTSPIAGGSVIYTGGAQAAKATFDQKLAAVPTSTMSLFNLTSGNFVSPDSVGLMSSNSAYPASGTLDTLTDAPASGSQMGAGNHFRAAVHAVSDADNTLATDKTFDFWMVSNAAPSPTQSDVEPTVINNQNASAVTFTGHGAPGLTVTVSLTANNAAPSTPSNPAVASGSALIQPSTCTTAPSCPWSVTVDASQIADRTYYWSAAAKDGNSNSTLNTTVHSIVKDTTAPCSTPTVQNPQPCQPTLSWDSGSNTAFVTATNDGSVTSWHISLADEDGHTLAKDVATSGDLSSSNSSIDTSTLDDGTLTATVTAVDGAGNATVLPTATATKDVGLQLDFVGSSFNGGSPTFPTAVNSVMKSPNSITLAFTQPVKASYTDQTATPSPRTHFTTVCVRDQFGSCAVFSTQPTIAADGKSLTVNIPSLLSDNASPYTVEVTAYSKNLCPDKTAQNTADGSWSCEALSGIDTPYVVQNPNTASDARFFIDSTPPAAPSITMPALIDASNVSSVPVSGTAEPGSTVVVSITSTGGSGTYIANPGGTVAGSDGKYAFSTSLKSMADGTLTVQAVATDAAGNVSQPGQVSPQPVLQTRPTAPQNLSAAAGNGQAVLSWLAPASTGGVPLTGYSLTVTDTSVPGSATPSFSIDPAATSYTVTGLANGHSYSFSLTAANNIGSGPAATTSGTPKGNTAVSVIASRGTITYSQFLAIHGTLSYFGVGVANEPVTITSVYFNGHHGATYHVTTDQYGNWVVAGLSPGWNITYVASFAGDSAYNASSSAAGVRVRVLIRVLHARAANSSHLTAVHLNGNVLPNHRYRRVYLYEVLAHGRLHYLGYTKLTWKSTWYFTRTFARGRHTVVARFLSQQGNYGNWSNRIRFSRS